MYKYHNEDDKAIGTDGWDADREESSSCMYTGLWNDSTLVGLIVESLGDDDSHHEMVARFHAKARDIVKKCNAYDELLAIQAQLVKALGKITTEYIRTRAMHDGLKMKDDFSKYEEIMCVENSRKALAAAGAQP